MAANRIKGIRCALCWNRESAIMARKHNDANMVSLGEKMISSETAIEIVKLWLETPFEGGRHISRIRQLDEDFSQNERSQYIKPEQESSDQDDFNVLISFGYILYSEGKNTAEFKVEPGLKGPTLIHIPAPDKWNKAMPEWMQNRREEIVERIAQRCKHMIYEFREI